ncbi:MAG: hypothetical protein K9M51_02185 [Candidatus Gracilibacteria bacterium]|nr:hypothetical protein [Candidatus Gracilibacteria bacterium]
MTLEQPISGIEQEEAKGVGSEEEVELAVKKVMKETGIKREEKAPSVSRTPKKGILNLIKTISAAVAIAFSSPAFSQTQEQDFDAQVKEATEYFLKRFKAFPDSADIVTADGEFDSPFFREIEKAMRWDEMVAFSGAVSADTEFAEQRAAAAKKKEAEAKKREEEAKKREEEAKKREEEAKKKEDWMMKASVAATSIGDVIEQKNYPSQAAIEELVKKSIARLPNNPYIRQQMKVVLETYGYDTDFLKDGGHSNNRFRGLSRKKRERILSHALPKKGFGTGGRQWVFRFLSC